LTEPLNRRIEGRAKTVLVLQERMKVTLAKGKKGSTAKITRNPGRKIFARRGQ